MTAEAVSTLLRGWARVGVRGRAPIRLRPRGKRRLEAGLNVGWTALEEELGLRAQLGDAVVGVLVGQAERQEAFGERLVRFSLADLERGVKEALGLAEQLGDVFAALEKILLFLDENGVIKLEKGLAVFRQSMRIRVLEEAKGRRYGGGTTPRWPSTTTSACARYTPWALRAGGAGRRGRQPGLRRELLRAARARVPGAVFRRRPGGARSGDVPRDVRADRRGPRQSGPEAIVTAPPERNILVLAGPGPARRGSWRTAARTF